MKIIDIADSSSLFLEYVKSEVNMLKKLQHKNIIQYLGSEQTKEDMLIYMECASKGDMRTMLDNKI
jgi:serine/threonine protein kinase